MLKKTENPVPASGKKRLILILSSVAVVAAGGVGAYALFARTAPPPPEKTDDAVKFIASDKFKKMPLAERQTYLQKAGRQTFQATRQMDDASRQAFRDNTRAVRMAEMNQRLDKFFKMSQAEQDAQLDKDLAEMKKRMDEFAQRQAQQGNNGNQPPRGQRTPPSAQARRERDADMNPTTRAKMQVYMEKMRQRAAATGQPMPRPGRR